MSDESFLIDKWIFERLSTDTVINTALGTRIYEGLAPQGAAYPFIIYQEQSPARDIRGIGTQRIMVEAFYLIKVITTGNYSSIKTLVDRFDFLFHGIQIETSYARINASVRERTFRLAEPRENVIYRHRGSIYRIQAQAI
jgi:hypothetical protein